MFMDDKRKEPALEVIMGKLHENDPSEPDHELDSCVDEMFAALESKDKEGFKQSLQSFIDIQMEHESSETPEAETSEGPEKY